MSLEIQRKPLAGWTLLIAGGSSFVGLRPLDVVRSTTGTRLDPLYQLLASLEATPKGPRPLWQIVPILLLPSWADGIVPVGAMLREGEDIDFDEQQALRDVIDKHEERLRRARGGIELASAMPARGRT